MSFPRLLLPFLLLFPANLALAASEPVVAGPCANCHGPDGHSPGAIPSIAGMPQAEMEQRLKAFREESGAAATIMPRLMKGYDDAQIAELARWFSELPK